MRKSFKFRIYPTRAQIEILLSILRSCRFLYNCALEQRRDTWASRKQSLTAYTQIKQLPEVRKEFPEFNAIYSQILQDVLRRLDKGFRGFFLRLKCKSGKAGFPRFKSADFFNSFTYPQVSNGSVNIKHKKIWLSKIGAIKMRKHRDIEGTPKTVTIKCEGKCWYVIISCDNVPVKVLPPAEKEEVGIDLGLNRFATLSDETMIENPRWFRKSEQRLKEAQRILALKKKGTSARRKARQHVAAIHRKISNQRRDFLHKKSRELVNKYSFIVVEDLGIKEMLRNKEEDTKQDTGLHKSIGDAGWSMFVWFLCYKAEEAGNGRRVRQVNPQNTTRTCSRCGRILREGLPLSQREFFCPHCFLLIDRDLNASLNTLQAGRLPVSGAA